MSEVKKETTELTILERFELSKEKEFDSWKKKGLELIKENPFIEIKDSDDYKEAKKRRTAVRKGRTEIQNQDKALASGFAGIRKRLKVKAEELILDIMPTEQKQQDEIDRYEKELSEKRLAKQKAEEQRIQSHKDNIETFEVKVKEELNSMNIGNSIVVKGLIEDHIEQIEEVEFEEFDILKQNAIEDARNQYDEKCVELEEARKQAEIQAEKDRELERLKLENERREKENAELKRKEQERIESERKEKERIEIINSTLKANEEDLNDVLFNIMPSSGSFKEQKERVDTTIAYLENIEFDFQERSEDFKALIQDFKAKSELNLEKLKKDIEKEEELENLRSEKAKREAEEVLKRIQEESKKRIEFLLSNGFVEGIDALNEKIWENKSIGHDYSIEFIEDSTETGWKNQCTLIEKDIQGLKDSEERQKRLFSDKNIILEEFNNCFANFGNLDDVIQNPETKELYDNIKLTVESFQETIIKEIEKL